MPAMLQAVCSPNESDSMDTITRQIAEYASALTFEDLDTATVQAATQRLIDALGCALGAHDCEPAQIGRRIAQGQAAGRYPGHVICYGGEAPLEIAAFIGTAAEMGSSHVKRTAQNIEQRTIGIGVDFGLDTIEAESNTRHRE